MKAGISKSDRDDMAKMALVISQSLPAAEAKATISAMYDCNRETARRLISRGRFLALNVAATAKKA